MRRVLSFAVFATLSIASSGCAPSQATLDNADYGPRPVDYKATVNAWLDQTLIDPESKRVTFKTQPVKEYTSFSTPPAGWVVCGYVNSKNRLGGYAGNAAFWVLIYLDRVVGGRVANGGNNLGIFAPATCVANL